MARGDVRPWNAAGVQLGLGATSYGNVPTVMSALGFNGLKLAWSVLLNEKDPLGNKIIVKPNTLPVSSMDALHAPMLAAPPGGCAVLPGPSSVSRSAALSRPQPPLQRARLAASSVRTRSWGSASRSSWLGS